MFSSRFFLRASGAALALGAIASCSSSAQDGATSSGEAITRCPPGYSWQTDIGLNGKLVGSCVQDDPSNGTPPTPPSILTATLAVPAANATLYPNDTCGTIDAYAPPSNLAWLGCTRGISIDGQIVFACPSAATIPFDLLYLVDQTKVGQGACYDTLGGRNPNLDYTLDATKGGCEATLVRTNGFDSKCLGSPKPGWNLVIDAILDVAQCPAPPDAGNASWNPGVQPPGPIGSTTYIAPNIPISSSCNSGCVPLTKPPVAQ
jgi:hypothetical protein